MSWDFSSLTASLQSAAESSFKSIREASEAATAAASQLKQQIEKDLSDELAVSNASSVPSTNREKAALTHDTQPTSSTFERAKEVGAAVLNPLQDTGGTVSEVAPPDKVIMLPWEQPGLSERTRSRMRGLSTERSIFLAPPTGGSSSFCFDLEASLPLVLEALRVDKHLEQQRHRLVPVQVSEDQFFTNYFHHLHVLSHGGVHDDSLHILPSGELPLHVPSIASQVGRLLHLLRS